MFISLDGVDGVGKSTQIALLADWLRAAGRTVVTCRDPGSTAVGESLRRIVLDEHETPIDRLTEMLIYMAARAQLVQQIIRPTLEAGQVVLSDRFLLANIVYQGYAGGLEVEHVRQVGQVATGGLLPHLTIVLDMPAEQAQRRRSGRPDRMEAQGLEYLERVRQGFLAEAERDPRRIRVVDASRTVEQVQQAIREHVSQVE